MKIRQKIALLFTILTSLVILSFSIFIFIFARQYLRHEFFKRLEGRAKLAAQIFLEEDKGNASIYAEIRDKHFQTLPKEKEWIIKLPVSEATRENVKTLFPETFMDLLIEDGYGETEVKGLYYVGVTHRFMGNNYIVIVSASNDYGEEELKDLRLALIIGFVLCNGVIFLLGHLYARQVFKPITEMIREVNKIRASNLHLRLNTNNSKDELAELATTFNNMLDRLETSFEIQNNFISNASHEFRSPLTAIIGEAEVALSKERSSQDYIDSLQAIANEAERLDHLTTNLLKLAQTSYDDKGLIIEEFRVDELIFDIKGELDKTNPDNKVNIDFSRWPTDTDQLVVYGSQSLLKIALSNIVGNACKFSENKIVHVAVLISGNDLVIRVKDQGVGIPSDEIQYIYDPFFRATNVRRYKGFGIGLPLTQKILQLHNGQIHVHSSEGKGTIVELHLPLKHQPVSR
ncbi:ATP-binding protein [Rapidithrix thailandica]|uniref:histidine kinase n=1 Tax=Rapidithrix thailandica TaxID=413964 RepID=A0AAW9S631_9BACT